MAKERLSRSDKGVIALVRSFMKDGMGLSPETIGLVIKRIRDSGEFASTKNHLRGLSGSTYKRINQAIDMAEEDAAKMQKNDTKEEEPEKEEQPEEKAPVKKEEKPEEKKEVKESFMSYLLSEVNVRDIAQQEIEATGDKKERMQKARMGDTQLKRARQDELRAQQTSKDPIDKKILQLQQQIAKLRKQKKQKGDMGGDGEMM